MPGSITTRQKAKGKGRNAKGLVLLFFLVPCSLFLVPSSLPSQVKPDQAADMLLAGARRAYNEKNYPFAAGRFREFLARFGNHQEAASARYGLALSLLEGTAKDYAAATEQLQMLAGNKEFPEHPLVLYYLGLAQRGLGNQDLAQAAAKPQEATPRRAAAKQRFEEAAKQFAAAATALAATAKESPADAKELPIDREWVCRARCDLAEMQLRTLKAKDAQATAALLLKDPVLAKSRYHGEALYYHGFASFLLNEYLAAGRSLNHLTPFTDPVYGTHARYLLARIHHLTDERKEAADHYEGVLADHAKQKQAAAEALRRPETFKNDPEERARLESLVRGPPPDDVARATFHLGVLLYENGQFADALARFDDFAKQHPKSPLLADAQLRQGFCRVQLRQFADAVRTLQPLADKDPSRADQALLWIAKAQVAAADPNNAQAYGQGLRAALDTLRRAAERAQQLAGSDPEASCRRVEILLELADTQQLAKQYQEAVATYGQILTVKNVPERGEEILERLVTALHLAGEYNESDKLCTRFQQAYPQSTLLPAVLFRHAENAYFLALAAEKDANLPNRAQELARLNGEAAKRYQVVVDRFPEFAYVNLARFGLGLAFYRKGDLEKAKQTLESIPQPERNGALAQVPYLLAECHLRLAPARADDALAAGRLEEELKGAAELLEAYIGAQPHDPLIPDALLKLGLCHQRLAALLAQPAERAKVLGNARAAYEGLIRHFPKHALQPQAIFERAKCLAQAEDKQNAIRELQRFTNDPLKTASVAPMALIQLSLLLREQRKANDAAHVLAQGRQQHESAMAKDPPRAGWVPALQYHHGLALKEAGKLGEARAIFDQLAKQFPARPEGVEAVLRGSQCLQEEGLAKIEAARKARAAAQKPEELAAANNAFAEGLKAVQEAVKYLDKEAEQLKAKADASEIRARMLYEAAWGYRALAEHEVAAARSKIQLEQLKKRQEQAAQRNTQARELRAVSLPEVPLTAVPLQPAEQKARDQYQTLIASFPDLPLANDARFELAELYAERSEHDSAVKLLNEALDKEVPADLSDKIRVRLGACYAAKKDAKGALAQFEAVAQNPKSTMAGEAHYRAGECLLKLRDGTEAVKHFVIFRDQPPFQNLPGLTDRALLRLGHAFAHLKQWDQSRQAHELVVNRFGKSPWVQEARYGIGWAWQNQRQYDNAVNAYVQVTAATATETAAKAQLQIGLCRLEQKRHADAAKDLLVVPFTYDYPEWNAIALCEAARAFTELKQTDHAENLLKRVLKEHPESKWAQVAKDRLETLTR